MTEEPPSASSHRRLPDVSSTTASPILKMTVIAAPPMMCPTDPLCKNVALLLAESDREMQGAPFPSLYQKRFGVKLPIPHGCKLRDLLMRVEAAGACRLEQRDQVNGPPIMVIHPGIGGTSSDGEETKVDDCATSWVKQVPVRRCKMVRPPAESRSSAPRVVCRHWAKGFCERGASCNFSHPATLPTAEEGKSDEGGCKVAVIESSRLKLGLSTWVYGPHQLLCLPKTTAAGDPLPQMPDALTSPAAIATVATSAFELIDAFGGGAGPAVLSVHRGEWSSCKDLHFRVALDMRAKEAAAASRFSSRSPGGSSTGGSWLAKCIGDRPDVVLLPRDALLKGAVAGTVGGSSDIVGDKRLGAAAWQWRGGRCGGAALVCRQRGLFDGGEPQITAFRGSNLKGEGLKLSLEPAAELPNAFRLVATVVTPEKEEVQVCAQAGSSAEAESALFAARRAAAGSPNALRQLWVMSPAGELKSAAFPSLAIATVPRGSAQGGRRMRLARAKARESAYRPLDLAAADRALQGRLFCAALATPPAPPRPQAAGNEPRPPLVPLPFSVNDPAEAAVAAKRLRLAQAISPLGFEPVGHPSQPRVGLRPIGLPAATNPKSHDVRVDTLKALLQALGAAGGVLEDTVSGHHACAFLGEDFLGEDRRNGHWHDGRPDGGRSDWRRPHKETEEEEAGPSDAALSADRGCVGYLQLSLCDYASLLPLKHQAHAAASASAWPTAGEWLRNHMQAGAIRMVSAL